MKMKKFKKAMKNFKKVRLSLGMKIIALLSCVALLSMGFASWWIIKVEQPTEVTTGSFTAYEVEEKNVKLTISEKNENDSTIIFGLPTSSETFSGTNYGWLMSGQSNSTNTVATSNMEYTYKFKVQVTSDSGTLATGVNINSVLKNVIVTVAPTEATATLFTQAITRGYITSPVVTYKIGDSTNSTASNWANSQATLTVPLDAITGNEVEVSVTITFSWGAAFGGETPKNPYNYYNAIDPDTTRADTYDSNNNNNTTETLPITTIAAAALQGLKDTIAGTTPVQYEIKHALTRVDVPTAD